MDIDQLRYPVGKYAPPTNPTALEIKEWIDEIKALPDLVEKEIVTMSPSDMKKPYRPDGWNSTQVIHHLADSHMNSFVRFKLSMTEDHPTITPYLENEWAKMPDENELDARVSLELLKALHTRWTYMLDRISLEDLQSRGYFHPEQKRVVPLVNAVALYAWHCRHHLAHIRIAKNA